MLLAPWRYHRHAYPDKSRLFSFLSAETTSWTHGSTHRRNFFTPITSPQQSWVGVAPVALAKPPRHRHLVRSAAHFSRASRSTWRGFTPAGAVKCRPSCLIYKARHIYKWQEVIVYPVRCRCDHWRRPCMIMSAPLPRTSPRLATLAVCPQQDSSSIVRINLN